MRKFIKGEEIKSLMRSQNMTIKSLAQTMGITQKRVRYVRENGLQTRHSCWEWLFAITGEEPRWSIK